MSEPWKAIGAQSSANRARNFAALALVLLRHGGAGRAVIVATCTALVSSLLFVIITVAWYASSPLWSSSDWAPQTEDLGSLVTEGGIRSGYVVALLLICLAPLTLLRQVLRLGTATREQRLIGLRLAGATPREVGLLSGLEVGMPAFVGALFGYALFLGLRVPFGGVPRTVLMDTGQTAIRHQLRLIPTTVSPTWWQIMLVALGVGLVGVLVGMLETRRTAVTPLGARRPSAGDPPRPWLALNLLGAATLLLWFIMAGSAPSGASGIAMVALTVLGLLALTPWLAYSVGRAVLVRATSPHALLAAGRLVADPRPSGRAAAVLSVIGLVAAFGSGVVAAMPATSPQGGVDAFYAVPTALAAVMLMVCLLLVIFSLTVHSIETLIDHKRSIASLAAAGATQEDLVRAQRWEVSLIALPVTGIGLIIGTVATLVLLDGQANPYLWIPAVADLTVALLALGAVGLATRLTRPWLRKASDVANLRTA